MADHSYIEMLYRIELSNQKERWARYGAIIFAAVTFYLRYDDTAALVWGAVYIGLHLWLFRFILNNRHSTRAFHQVLAILWAAAVLAALLWYPVLQLRSEAPAAVFCGAAIIGCTCFYALARSDRDVVSLLVWVAAFAVSLLAALWHLMPQFTDPIDLIGVPVAAAALVGYFLLALMTARWQRQISEQAAERDTQEQKLAAIGRLAGGVAHDFNNALTGISGNLELYHLLEDPTEREEVLREAKASADRAGTLVRQLLVFSRRDGVRLDLVDVRDVLQEAAEFQRRLLPANVAFRLNIAPAITVEVDKDLLVTALINLSTNAVHAMPDGGALTMSARRCTVKDQLCSIDGRILPPGRYAFLGVADTGHGIPRDILPRVVEPFFSTKPVGEGSGLGLSMVVGLVQSLQGGLLIDTGPGGSTVSIVLPEAQPPGQSSADRREQQAEPARGAALARPGAFRS